MSDQVKIKQDSRDPTVRYFIISALPQSVEKLVILLDEEDADKAGCLIAANLFRFPKIDVQEIRLFAYDGHDAMCIIMKNAAEWKKSLDRGQQRPLEETIRAFLQKQVVEANNPLIKIGDNDASLHDMNAYLQKNKPSTVEADGGSVRAVEFNEEQGVLTIAFGKKCASGCVAGQQGTRMGVTALMRGAFPEVRRVDFTTEPAI